MANPSESIGSLHSTRSQRFIASSIREAQMDERAPLIYTYNYNNYQLSLLCLFCYQLSIAYHQGIVIYLITYGIIIYRVILYLLFIYLRNSWNNLFD